MSDMNGEQVCVCVLFCRVGVTSTHWTTSGPAHVLLMHVGLISDMRTRVRVSCWSSGPVHREWFILRYSSTLCITVYHQRNSVSVVNLYE